MTKEDLDSKHFHECLESPKKWLGHTKISIEYCIGILQELIDNNSESFEDGEYYAISAVNIDDIKGKIDELNGGKK